MRIIRGQSNLARLGPTLAAGAVTIGNFDGVHCGHQAVLAQVQRLAAEADLTTRVVVFEPQPNEFFAPGNPTPRLTRLAEKLRLFAHFGVDEVLVLRFDDAFAALSAERFIEQILVHGLRVRALVIGDDFRFGHGRDGDFAALQAAGVRFGFDVTRAATFAQAGERVSSTRIRAALAAHRFDAAARMLGRRYCIRGRVVHGRKQGRTIGFPTANIHLGRLQVPLAGIFAVRVHGLGSEPIPGSGYVGTRPVVADNQTVLEVHLFDFAGDLYGRMLEVEFVAFVRGDLPFTSMEKLKEQIARDNAEVRQILDQQPMRRRGEPSSVLPPRNGCVAPGLAAGTEDPMGPGA